MLLRVLVPQPSYSRYLASYRSELSANMLGNVTICNLSRPRISKTKPELFMDSVVVLPYSEYVCASALAKHFPAKDGFSVFAPLSRQEKGIDRLLCRAGSERHVATFQIK